MEQKEENKKAKVIIEIDKDVIKSVLSKRLRYESQI